MVVKNVHVFAKLAQFINLTDGHMGEMILVAAVTTGEACLEVYSKRCC